MSETSAVHADDLSPTKRVDTHLQRWRTETQKRRNAWAAKQADFIADQRQRRQRTAVFFGAAAFGFVATLGAAIAIGTQLDASASPFSAEPASPAFTSEPANFAPVAPRAPSDAEPVPEAPVEAPAAIEPVAAVPIETPIVPSEAVSTPAPTAAVEPTPAELGATSVASWTRNGTLWIQVDTVPGRELRWLDARGAEALERTPCAYALSDGGMRCYIGRTRARIDSALAAGAVPGSWRADLCDGEACTTVATYPVER